MPPRAAKATDASGAPVTAALTEPTAPVRYVRLEALTEALGQDWSSVAEFNLLDVNGVAVSREGWTASADSNDSSDIPAHAIDGDPLSIWHTQWNGASPRPPHQLVIDMGKRVRLTGFRYLPRQDSQTNGFIAKFRLSVSNDGREWGPPVTSGDFTTMGTAREEKTVVFAHQTVNHPPAVTPLAAQSVELRSQVSLRVAASDADDDKLAYAASGLPPGLSIGPGSGMIVGTPLATGSFQSTVTVTDGKGGSVPSTIAWNVTAPVAETLGAASAASTPAPAAGLVRFVKLEEVSELTGQAWASMAEFNLLDENGSALARTGWTASADSMDALDLASNALDGNPATHWHTRWDGVAPMPPHVFIVDLHAFVKVGGFRYLPRQDTIRNGTIAKYRFYVSGDGSNWGKPVSEGDLSTLGPATSEKTVRFKCCTPQQRRNES